MSAHHDNCPDCGLPCDATCAAYDLTEQEQWALRSGGGQVSWEDMTGPEQMALASLREDEASSEECVRTVVAAEVRVLTEARRVLSVCDAYQTHVVYVSDGDSLSQTRVDIDRPTYDALGRPAVIAVSLRPVLNSPKKSATDRRR